MILLAHRAGQDAPNLHFVEIFSVLRAGECQGRLQAELRWSPEYPRRHGGDLRRCAESQGGRSGAPKAVGRLSDQTLHANERWRRRGVESVGQPRSPHGIRNRLAPGNSRRDSFRFFARRQRRERRIPPRSKRPALRRIQVQENRVGRLNRRSALRCVMRSVRSHLQWAEARLDAVDGVEYRGRYQCDYSAGYIRGGTGGKYRGVHHPNPLQHRVWRGSRYWHRTSSEQRRNQQQHCAPNSRASALPAL